jgi:2-C-methyl-D-erythritol 2,4-cyclodiphosphate synthase
VAAPSRGARRPKPAADSPGRRLNTKRGKTDPVANPLACRPPTCRVGFGNDVHRLEPGRALVLAGVAIPFDKGPAGHSDGDALSHALCDAMLGAAALGDIGRHFSNRNPRWKNAPSLIFLKHAQALLRKAGYEVVNLDATVSLERPKLAPYIPLMRQKLAEALGLDPDRISIKAKTGEGVDAVGLGTAIRADAVALLYQGTTSVVPKTRMK